MSAQYVQHVLCCVMALYIILTVYATLISAYPASIDEDKFDKESMTPGAHQLASWLTYLMRKNDYLQQQSEDSPMLHYRLSGGQGKRNSELSNSMMGLPKNMIDNGKK
ncbi:pigment-dispersing hormone peptides-like isoform X2 [Photinus pyralis]|uniref:pigment-dispersing hormone peptides-like isoform X2 n=1 Tax=Photinus pyralis TaxID=7054 RepID=UPI001267645F|nr:pigment-dispersing hormone peptides-like isoform X2 [Photinus pyralis]